MLKNKIITAVNKEIERFPELSITDLYKFFYQGEFGPNHFIDDRKSAEIWLTKELESIEDEQVPILYNVGLSDNFLRVDLRFIKQQIISMEELFEMFLKSTKKQVKYDKAQWSKLWVIIHHELLNCTDICYKSNLDDIARVNNALESDDMSIHHSNHFKKLYKPHYRLISRKILLNSTLAEYLSQTLE